MSSEINVINFGAGPAKLPKEVLLDVQKEFLSYQNEGMGIVEISHRSEEYAKINSSAQSTLRELLNVPVNYKILFMHGGGQGAFSAIPMNLMSRTGKADYLVTGTWSSVAANEAKKYGQVNIVNARIPGGIPDPKTWKLNSDASYVFYCDNDTIDGVEFSFIPETEDIPLVADMSSNLLTKKLDVSKKTITLYVYVLNVNTLKMVYSALVESIINYGLVVWGNACKSTMSSLHVAQKYVLKIMLHKSRLFPSELLFKESKLLNIDQLYIKSTIRFMIMKKYYRSVLQHKLNTRAAVRQNIFVPHVARSATQAHIAYIGPKVYNILPLHLRNKPYKQVKHHVNRWIVESEVTFGVIFAASQKNLGPASVAVLIVREDLLGNATEYCPSILDFTILDKMDSILNTPPIFSIYVMDKVFHWIRKSGGLTVMETLSEQKSSLVYNTLELHNTFYFSPVCKNARSRINIPFRIGKSNGDEELEDQFLREAEERNMLQLKGHHLVGGIRVSLFNSITVQEKPFGVFFIIIPFEVYSLIDVEYNLGNSRLQFVTWWRRQWLVPEGDLGRFMSPSFYVIRNEQMIPNYIIEQAANEYKNNGGCKKRSQPHQDTGQDENPCRENIRWKGKSRKSSRQGGDKPKSPIPGKAQTFKNPTLGQDIENGTACTYIGYCTKSITKALEKKGVPSLLCRWINASLEKRVIISSIGETTVTARTGRGCPQGGVLSPLLWAILVDELLKRLTSKGMHCLGYADDVAIIAKGKFAGTVSEHTQTALNIINKWCQEEELTVNPLKTTIVVFTKKKVLRGLKPPVLNGVEIPIAQEVKYLGVIFDHKLTWNQHLQKIIQKSTIALNLCRRMCGKNWGLKPKMIIWLYRVTQVIGPPL
ncbi:unnamed protein product [Phaedon cochleariae]|uniref:phosphoserine transaminase n=1 Tax=Phaedon cochleariae TaxID=80249 RepID=A0A9N9SBT9_PHACE|nr:unnamed protein product [Phaedon cochleariae]